MYISPVNLGRNKKVCYELGVSLFIATTMNRLARQVVGTSRSVDSDGGGRDDLSHGSRGRASNLHELGNGWVYVGFRARY